MTDEQAGRTALTRVERDALAIIFSQFEGRVFNWMRMEFEPEK